VGQEVAAVPISKVLTEFLDRATLEEVQQVIMAVAVAVLAQLVWLALVLAATVGLVFLRISRALALLTLGVEVVLRHLVVPQEG
jgi:hypothetical protein